MKIIVNADDFGMSEMIVKAIDESFRHKWISQSTLMVNMPFADSAVRLAKQNGYWDRIGLHLNLTRGNPLTEEMRLSHFCDEAGAYDKSILTDKRMFLPYCKHEQDMIRKEIRAQIERFLSYRPIMMHADGHQHLHTRLPLTNIILPLLSEYGFKSVRRTYSTRRGLSIRTAMLAVRNKFFLRKVKDCRLITADSFGGFFGLGACDQLRMMRDKVVEIMVHPRYDKDGNIVDTVDYYNNTGVPLAEVAGKFKRLNCEMITFADLYDR